MILLNASFRKATPVLPNLFHTATGKLPDPVAFLFVVFLRAISISAYVVYVMPSSTSACCSFLHTAGITGFPKSLLRVVEKTHFRTQSTISLSKMCKMPHTIRTSSKSLDRSQYLLDELYLSFYSSGVDMCWVAHLCGYIWCTQPSSSYNPRELGATLCDITCGNTLGYYSYHVF